MGWLDNLEQGLSSNDQPGPSGVTTTRVQSIKNSIDIDDEESTSTNHQNKTPGELFAEQVTIAGLQEAYNAKLKIDRIMFRIALVAACIMIVIESRQIVIQYQDQETVILDRDITDSLPQFPNVSICFPPIFNERRFYQVLAQNPEVIQGLKKTNASPTDLSDLLKKMITLTATRNDRNAKYYIPGKKAFDKALSDAAEKGQHLYWDVVQTPCSETLSNCEYQGKRFDCCAVAEFSTVWTVSCFQMAMNWLPRNDRTRDPIRLQDAGLSLTVTTDLANVIYENDVVSLGFHIFLETLPEQTQVPVHVPAGMDVIIMLAESKKLDEQTGCRKKAQQLKHFDHEDPNGILCQLDMCINLTSTHLGCTFPLATYHYANDSCPFDLLFFLSLILSNGGIDFELGKAMNAAPESDPLIILGKARDSPICWPLCSRWSYPVFSATYSLIQKKDNSQNDSMTQIRIIQPQSSHHRIELSKPSAVYLAMCDIGGMMGVYAGFSMITIIQVLAYGLYVAWSGRKGIMRKLKREHV